MKSQSYYFRGTRNSLGEAYHVAMHGALIPADEALHFGLIPDEDDKYAHHLFELLDDLEIPYWKNLNCNVVKGLSETANTIFERFHCDQINKKKQLIVAMADREKWEAPFLKCIATDPGAKLLIWLRNEQYQPWRNTNYSFVSQLISLALKWGLKPVLIGRWVFDEAKPAGIIDLGEFWNDPFFKDQDHFYFRQLWFQHSLFSCCNVKASLGMMSGAIDGAAMFFGHKTIFFACEEDAKPRMTKVASVVPGLNWFPIVHDMHGEKPIDQLTDQQAASLQSMIGR